MGRLNSKKTKAFLDVVKTNPDLPIVPIVSEDLCSECNVGEFGIAKATSVAYVKFDCEVILFMKEEQEELEDRIAEDLLADDEALTVEQASAAAHEQAEALDWQKAIVVYIYASEVDA